MNFSAKPLLFSIGLLIPVAILTWSNYQRFVGHQELATRTSNSLDSCQQLKKEIETQYDVESLSLVFSPDSESDAKNIEIAAKNASIGDAVVAPGSSKKIGESEYSAQKTLIQVQNRVSLIGLMEFVTRVTNGQTGSKENQPQTYWLSSLVIEAPPKTSLKNGQREVWICKELTLSHIVKSDKSPQ